jgi:hypothetical protein
MGKPPTKLAAIIAATAAAGLSGAAIAGAAGSTSSTSSTSTTQPRQSGGPGAGETALTGETKQKVEAAALAKVSGTVIRTETDHDGVYESHIRKSDGTEVEVRVNKAFEVTSVQERPAGGRGGGHGHGGPGGRGKHADLAAVAKALGVTEAKLSDAVQAARPQKPASGTRAQRGADVSAAIAKALAVAAADVQRVLEANRPERSGKEWGPRSSAGQSALVAALVKKFSVSTAKAQAAVDAVGKAHEAEHEERETALYAAVAKVLGKDTAAVQKAFEANRPAKPTR